MTGFCLETTQLGKQRARTRWSGGEGKLLARKIDRPSQPGNVQADVNSGGGGDRDLATIRGLALPCLCELTCVAGSRSGNGASFSPEQSAMVLAVGGLRVENTRILTRS